MNHEPATHLKHDKIFESMCSAIENIVIIIGKANINDRGPFVKEFQTAIAGFEAMQANIIKATAVDDVSASSNDESFKPPAELLEGLKSSWNWQSFLDKSCEGGAKIGDSKDWPAADIINLFNHHGLILQPFPNRRILDQIAHELVKFRMACMSLLDSAPSDEQYEALGRKSMGTDDEKDREVVAALYAPAKHDTFIADPQIPSNFSLNKLTILRIPDVDNIFSRCAALYAIKYHQKKIHEVLELIDLVAETWDRIYKNPGTDWIEQYEASEGVPNSMKNLAIRPIELWSFNVENCTIPVLGVECISASQRTAGPESIRHFSEGLRKDTYFQKKNISEDAMDLLVSLLQENRSNLDENDPIFKAYKKKVPKGWKFLILRPVDPSKRSGVRLCPEYGKTASQVCSRCKMVAYCSRECQSAQRKKHKASCRKVATKK